jgi:hypothetical protein
MKFSLGILKGEIAGKINMVISWKYYNALH